MEKHVPTKATVLVVDDEEDLQEIIQQWLQSESIRVLKASNGHEALRILNQTSVDLVLSDIRMPEVDGISLLERTKASPSAKAEVLLMTGYFDKSRGDAMSMGAGGIIQKPFTSRELLSWLHLSVSPRLKPLFEKKLRLAISLSVHFGKDKNHLYSEGTVKNLSLNGLLVATQDSLPHVGEHITVQVQFGPGENVTLNAKIQWARAVDNASYKNEMGLELMGCAETNLHYYKKYVRELIAKKTENLLDR